MNDRVITGQRLTGEDDVTAIDETKDLVARFISALLAHDVPRQRVEDYGNDIVRLLNDIEAEATAAAEQRLRERETPEYFESGLLAAWRRTKDFLADRLITSGRSDVSVNAVLRVMNSAFDEPPPPASPRQGVGVESSPRLYGVGGSDDATNERREAAVEPEQPQDEGLLVRPVDHGERGTVEPSPEVHRDVVDEPRLPVSEDVRAARPNSVAASPRQGEPVDPSDCPRCGEWRDSPEADCAECSYKPLDAYDYALAAALGEQVGTIWRVKEFGYPSPRAVDPAILFQRVAASNPAALSEPAEAGEPET